MKRRLFRRFADLGIRNKLLLSFVLLISVPVLIIAIRSFMASGRIIEQKTNQYSHDILYQVTKTMEARLEKIEDISFNIIMNQDVQASLLNAGTRQLEPYEANLVRTRIESVLSSQVLYHDEINAIYVVSSDGYVYELDKTKQHYGLMEAYVNEIRDAKGSIIWYGGMKGVVALARCINSTRTQKPVGYLVAYVEEKFLFELINRTYSVAGGDIFVIDGNGIIVSAGNKDMIGTVSGVVHSEGQTEAYLFSTQTVDNQTQYVALSEPMKNGWRIVMRVPISAYQSEIATLRNTILLFAAVVLVLSVLLAWGLSMSISRPIRLLSTVMERFGEGDFSARCPVEAKDETGMLSATFNNMAKNINELVQKVYDEQLMKRDAELKSLQMQINPHFLYNTLETINWMARTHGTEDIGIMVKSLGDLMRATINGRDSILLKDEIVSLNNYLQIQKYRYIDKFSSDFDIEPDTELLFVPKLIVQPLVENALYHGIRPSLSNGTIIIRSRLENESLIIEVCDDGVGMTAEMIENVLDTEHHSDPSSPGSIGLQNVIKRIKVLYGNGYGIEIQSELGEGTKTTVRLPAIKDV